MIEGLSDWAIERVGLVRVSNFEFPISEAKNRRVKKQLCATLYPLLRASRYTVLRRMSFRRPKTGRFEYVAQGSSFRLVQAAAEVGVSGARSRNPQSRPLRFECYCFLM